MNQYLKQYQKTHVETAPPERILVMLFEGAIQFLNKSKIAMEKEDIQDMHNNLIGAQNIIYEFINTLDPKPNPDVAENLRRLYQYMIERLVEANMKRKIEPIDEVLGFLRELKETWEKAILIAKEENGGEAIVREEVEVAAE